MKTTDGCKRLRAWMARMNMNQVEAAEEIGIGYYLFNKLMTGARLPGRDAAVQIQQKTGIPVEAWVSKRLDKKRRELSAVVGN